MDHCKKVFCELFAATALSLIEKDESGARAGDNPLDLCEAVTMGHHNFADQFLFDVFQKPREALGGDITVDIVVWKLRLCPFDLPPEVLPAEDPTVHGALPRFLLGGGSDEVGCTIGWLSSIVYTALLSNRRCPPG